MADNEKSEGKEKEEQHQQQNVAKQNENSYYGN